MKTGAPLVCPTCGVIPTTQIVQTKYGQLCRVCGRPATQRRRPSDPRRRGPQRDREVEPL